MSGVSQNKGGKPEGVTAGPILLRREMVAFLPAVALAGLWFGLEAMTLLGATAVIVAWMTRPLMVLHDGEDERARGRIEAEAALNALIKDTQTTGRSTTCLVLGLDDAASVARPLTRTEHDRLSQALSERIHATLRESDRVVQLDELRFAIVLTPTLRPDLESMIQLSARLQQACEAPYSIEAQSLNVTCHIGFCLLKRAPEQTGAAVLCAAEAAAAEAERNGPSAIRAYSTEISTSAVSQSDLSAEFAQALEAGQIVAFFEPQIYADTGEISGMQAVPRWMHRERGILTEAEIAPALAASGQHQRLAEILLYQSFNALRELERLSPELGPISMPLTLPIAADPKVADRMKWEFDRFDIAPHRLRLVLPQDVTAQITDEVIGRNIAQAARMGCPIELAGFGAGPTSVTAIRRTGADRIRIHRSFVTNLDKDPEQQRLVAAIISFAEGMGLETLAEGVNTVGEHAALAQLGCGHVQGKAISTALPLDECMSWLERHRAKLASTRGPTLRRGG